MSWTCSHCGKKLTNKQVLFIEQFFANMRKKTTEFGKKPICKKCFDEFHVVPEMD